MDLSMSVPARKLATNSVWCWSGIAAFCVLLPDISDGGAEMAGDLETDFELVALRSLCAPKPDVPCPELSPTTSVRPKRAYRAAFDQRDISSGG
jgi:hypothetical protein